MPSAESQAVRQMLTQLRAKAESGEPASIEQQRRDLDAMSNLSPVAEDVSVEQTTIAGRPAEWLSAPGAMADRVFLYLHGGAYYMGSCTSHRDLAARLSRACGMRALVVEYRLAPEHPYPAAIEDAVAAYRALVDSGYAPSQIVIGGDSAGGGLTVATLLSLRDAGDVLPRAAVLLSPWTDLEGTGESMETRSAHDPWLSAEGVRAITGLYIGDLDPRTPLVSPIYADLHGLPPTLVHVGHDEVLLDDSRRLVDRLQVAGVDVTFKIWEGMWHVFQSFASQVPEGRQAIDEIGDFVKSHLA